MLFRSGGVVVVVGVVVDKLVVAFVDVAIIERVL